MDGLICLLRVSVSLAVVNYDTIMFRDAGRFFNSRQFFIRCDRMVSESGKTREDLLTAIGLATLAFLLYLLAFSGEIRAMDELQLFDETESFALYQDVVANQAAFLWQTGTVKYEIGQPLLAVPLYLLGHGIDRFGIAHITLQFNLFVTSILVAFFYLAARDLGYSNRISLLGTLALGFGTILVPYTQTFYRESLTALTLFLSAYAAMRVRAAREAGIARWQLRLIPFAIMALLAILVRETALLLLPLICLVLLPDRAEWRQAWRRIALSLLIIAGIALLAVILLVLFSRSTQAFEVESRYDLVVRLGQFLETPWQSVRTGVVGMLASPGKAIWLYSPVLLLALAGPFLSSKDRWRETWLPLAMLLVLVVVYASLRERAWQGGVSWGPRYLVMITPFLMIASLPAIERLIDSRVWWKTGAFWTLLGASILVQIGGVVVNLYDFLDYRMAAVGIDRFERLPLWSFRWSQAIGHLLYLPHARSGILWLYDGVRWLPIILILVGVAGACLLLVMRGRSGRPIWRKLTIVSPFIAAAIMLVSLPLAYHDSRYFGDYPELIAMIDDLSRETTDDEMILLDSRRYVPAFMNYYRGDARWYSSPDAPGDLLNPSVAEPVMTDDLAEAVGQRLTRHLDSFLAPADEPTSILLISAGNEYVENAVRPAEWYLSLHSYPVERRDYAPMVRWVRFLPMAIPAACDSSGSITDEGEMILLAAASVQVRAGSDTSVSCGIGTVLTDALSPGEQIGVSVTWQVKQAPPGTLISTFQLRDSAGSVIRQFDGQPGNGFAPSAGWKPGDMITDNAGFLLEGLPPGIYAIAYGIYTWPEQVRWLFIDGNGAGEFIPVVTFTLGES